VVLFTLPLIDAGVPILDAVEFLNEVGVWALVIQPQPDKFRLIDFRDLVAEPDPSRPLSAAESEAVLAFKDIPNLEAMNRDLFQAAMRERQHAFIVREASQEDTADVVTVAQDLAETYLSDTPRKRCTRPNKPAGTPSRQWYHSYPPTTANANGICAEDGSAVR
jgi:hypothetical protein